MIKIELFSVPGCNQCVETLDYYKKITEEFRNEFEWRHVNLLEEIDYAVELGVLTTPAIVIDGELVFSSLPSVEKFRAKLLNYRSK